VRRADAAGAVRPAAPGPFALGGRTRWADDDRVVRADRAGRGACGFIVPARRSPVARTATSPGSDGMSSDTSTVRTLPAPLEAEVKQPPHVAIGFLAPIWSSRLLGAAAVVAVAAAVGLVSGWLTPRGPVTGRQVVVTMVVVLATGLVGGVLLGSRWSMLLVCPRAHRPVADAARRRRWHLARRPSGARERTAARHPGLDPHRLAACGAHRPYGSAVSWWIVSNRLYLATRSPRAGAPDLS
jgi:hypothetical protein